MQFLEKLSQSRSAKKRAALLRSLRSLSRHIRSDIGLPPIDPVDELTGRKLHNPYSW